MSNWLTDRLHAGAESATEGIVLEHPDEHDEVAVMADRRRRRPWVLAAAAAVVLLALFGTLVLRHSDDAGVVRTPAGPTHLGPIPDPRTAPAPEVVKAAIELTMAQSWVAQVVSKLPDDLEATKSTVTYVPAEDRPGGSHPYMLSRTTVLGQPRGLLLLPDGSNPLASCQQWDPQPCRAGAWYRDTGPMSFSREQSELSGLVVPSLNADSAVRGDEPDKFEVSTERFLCRPAATPTTTRAGHGCPRVPATVWIRDGLVRSVYIKQRKVGEEGTVLDLMFEVHSFGPSVDEVHVGPGDLVDYVPQAQTQPTQPDPPAAVAAHTTWPSIEEPLLIDKYTSGTRVDQVPGLVKALEYFGVPYDPSGAIAEPDRQAWLDIPSKGHLGVNLEPTTSGGWELRKIDYVRGSLPTNPERTIAETGPGYTVTLDSVQTHIHGAGTFRARFGNVQGIAAADANGHVELQVPHAPGVTGWGITRSPAYGEPEELHGFQLPDRGSAG